MQAQRLSLSQIHAAQLELLQEETDDRTHSLELKLQNLRDHGDHGEYMCNQFPMAKQTASQRGFRVGFRDPSQQNRSLALFLYFLTYILQGLCET